MKAVVVNCTLKSSPERSNTAALADVVAETLRKEVVEVSEVRAADHSIRHPDLARPAFQHRPAGALAAARALVANPIPAPPSE
jgi:multimeric flavodoxin WrbA